MVAAAAVAVVVEGQTWFYVDVDGNVFYNDSDLQVIQ